MSKLTGLRSCSRLQGQSSDQVIGVKVLRSYTLGGFNVSLQNLLVRIRNTPDCEVYPPIGLPLVPQTHKIPDDLQIFYELCGGVSLFYHQSWGFRIVPPTQMVLANPVLLPGQKSDQYEEAVDISCTWYLIADDFQGNYLTIDLSPKRLGRCYNSFFGYHASPGDCAIIARSFTELLTHLFLDQKEEDNYWNLPNFVSLGDAYDDIM